jgi:hypothetical protein
MRIPTVAPDRIAPNWRSHPNGEASYTDSSFNGKLNNANRRGPLMDNFSPVAVNSPVAVKK